MVSLAAIVVLTKTVHIEASVGGKKEGTCVSQFPIAVTKPPRTSTYRELDLSWLTASEAPVHPSLVLGIAVRQSIMAGAMWGSKAAVRKQRGKERIGLASCLLFHSLLLPAVLHLLKLSQLL